MAEQKAKKKKHRGRNLLLLVLALAVCCVGYVALRQANEAAENETTEAEELDALLEFSEDAEIVSLSYELDGETIALSYTDDETWERDGAEDFPINTSTVSTMVSTLTGASVSRVINEDGSNLEEYGLDEPAYTVTVTDSEDNTYIVLIGDDNSLAGGCYAMLDGTESVVLTDSDLATAFAYGWYDLASVDDAPDIDADAVQDITITQGDAETVFEYDEDGKSDIDATGSCNLYVKTEDGYQAIDDDSEDTILDAVEDFSYSALAAYQPDEETLVEYGLDEPTVVIVCNYTTEEEVEVESDDEDETDSDSETSETEETEEVETETIIVEHTYTLTVGAYDETNDVYYVQHDDSSSVFTMSGDTVAAFLDLDTTQMVRLDPTNVDEDSIDSIEVTLNGETRTYAIERDVVVETEEEETTEAADEETTAAADDETAETEEEEVETTTLYTLDGEDIEESVYSSVYDALADLEGVRLLNDGEAVDGEAELTVVFHRNTGELSTVTVEFIPYNENYYQVAVNGGEAFMVADIGDVEELEEALFVEISEEETEEETTEAAE